jgi:hypothetical protein
MRGLLVGFDQVAEVEEASGALTSAIAALLQPIQQDARLLGFERRSGAAQVSILRSGLASSTPAYRRQDAPRTSG